MSADHFINISREKNGSNGSAPMPPAAKSEKVIWADFLKGDETALSFIYCQYANSLYNYGRQFAGAELAQDCIQDLFYDLIRMRKKLSQTHSVKAYLYSSLRRRIMRALKRQVKEIEQSRLESETKFRIAFVPDNATPADPYAQSQLQTLKNACDQLTPRQREAILLYFFEKLSYKEVAVIMDIGKISSARILIYRAIDSLRKLLQGKKEEFISTLILLFLVR